MKHNASNYHLFCEELSIGNFMLTTAFRKLQDLEILEEC